MHGFWMRLIRFQLRSTNKTQLSSFSVEPLNPRHCFPVFFSDFDNFFVLDPVLVTLLTLLFLMFFVFRDVEPVVMTLSEMCFVLSEMSYFASKVWLTPTKVVGVDGNKLLRVLDLEQRKVAKDFKNVTDIKYARYCGQEQSILSLGSAWHAGEHVSKGCGLI